MTSTLLSNDPHELQRLIDQLNETLIAQQLKIESQNALLEKNKNDIATKQDEIVKHKTEIVKHKTEISFLREQIRLFRHKQFAKDRAINIAQLDLLFNEAEKLSEQSSTDATETESSNDSEEASVTHVAGYTCARGGRRPLPEHLPRVDVIHDIPENKKTCANGHALQRIGEDISEQLDIIPATIRVLRHVRIKYACRCCEGHVKTADLPAQPIPKSNASPGLIAHIAVAKYSDGLPLYRLETILGRCGIEIPRATSALWMIRTGELITPLMNLLRDDLLSRDYLHMDETTLQVLKEPDKPPTSTSYLWVRRTGGKHRPIIVFDYDASRSGNVPKRLLDGFLGALHTDGYDGYNAVVNQSQLIHLGCWAHVVRKFQDVLKAQKHAKGTDKATIALTFIKKLYAIERELADASVEHRHEQRQQRSLPIVNELRLWLDNVLSQIPPQSTLGKAIYYLHREWPKLIRCFDDGRYSLDNNPVENAIRPFVIGRNAWLFSDTVNGANASASIYSLIETAKANGHEPYFYLRYVIERLPQAKSLDEIEQLLPWNVDGNVLTENRIKS